MKTVRPVPATLKSSRRHRLLSFAAAVFALGAAGSVQADTYNFVLGTTPQAWNSAASWTNTTGGTGAFPNAVGDVANLNADLTANQVVNLNQAITVGTLNIGDTGTTASNGFTIATGGNAANVLTFQGATNGAATALNVNAAGLAASAFANNNMISANVTLGGSSPLTITANGLQTVVVTGTINTNGNALTLSTSNAGSGGGLSVANVTGSGNLIKVGVGRALYTGTSTTGFTGATTVNAGTLQIQASNAFLGSTSITVNTTGTIELGNNTFTTTGSLNTNATLTLNGGTLNYRGTGVTNSTNTQALSATNLAQGNSFLNTLSNATNNTQTVINAGALNRTAGATLQVQGSLLGQTGVGSTRIVTSAATAPTLVGGGGGSGSTNISIVPWAIGSTAAAGSNTFTGSNELATYDATNGFRPLTAGEYAALGSGTTTANNVSVTANTAVAANTTLNGLKINGATLTINAGQVLNITSGAALFSSTVGTLAGPGTVNFGATEGVISTAGANGTVSAVIAGSGGLTKGGTGLLTLTGINTYSGATTIAGGTLLTGATGNLGAGNTTLARGGALTLGNNASLNDSFSLILNSVSTVNLNYTGTETVAGVSLDSGTTFLAPNTYSVADLDAFGLTGFTGTGSLTIGAVPEPSEWVMIGVGATMFLVVRRRVCGRPVA